jgi:hypothetical protein
MQLIFIVLKLVFFFVRKVENYKKLEAQKKLTEEKKKLEDVNASNKSPRNSIKIDDEKSAKTRSPRSQTKKLSSTPKKYPYENVVKKGKKSLFLGGEKIGVGSLSRKKTKDQKNKDKEEEQGLLEKSKKALLKFIEIMNIISAWITFLLDWTIFFICFVSIIFLGSISDNIDFLIQSGCLDYNTSGQLQAFKIIILGIAFQSYEIMFLVLVRLFLIILSLVYMYLTKGKISFNEFSALCCDDEDDEEGGGDDQDDEKEKEEDPYLKKVDTIKNAKLDIKVAETEYQKNLEKHKKTHVV